jgi:molybdate transport system substrate-binding protein
MMDRRSFLCRIASHLPAAMLWASAPGAGSAHALTPSGQSVRVAAASDLKFVLTLLISQFQKETGILIEVTYGSSGNFVRQIHQGLPVDVFMSADENLLRPLVDAGLTQGHGEVYGRGRIALLVSAPSSLPLDARLEGLQAQWHRVLKFAIANPEHAPYGRAAQQALQALNLWHWVSPKLVLGENIAQATQFVTTGAAQAGITALPLARAPEVAAQARHLVLPAHLHAPLLQRMVLLKNASAAASQWFTYLQSAAARQAFKAFGFEER